MTVRGAQRGATLLEIIVAMVIIGMVAGGILPAFVFGRKVTWRSGTELAGIGLVQQTADRLRGVVNAGPGGGAGGLTLAPGIYADPNMQNAPPGTDATRPAGLVLPADFTRFLTDTGTNPSNINAGTHGDGQLVVVETTADLDGDNIWPAQDSNGDTWGDLDFNRDGQPDLRRVRVRVKWTTPST